MARPSWNYKKFLKILFLLKFPLFFSFWIQNDKELCLKYDIKVATFDFKNTKEILKIQRKIQIIIVFNIFDSNPIFKATYGIGLHSWGPGGSFDTHIALLVNAKFLCHMCHLCQKCQNCHFWHVLHMTNIVDKYVNMGVKRSLRTSGMQHYATYCLKNWF